MTLNVKLFLLPTVLLFQFIGTQQNEIDLDLMICRQAEEEFLQLRKEENEVVEGKVLGGRGRSGRSLAVSRLSNSSLLYELVTTNIYKAARQKKTKRSIAELSDWVLGRLQVGEIRGDGVGVCDKDSLYRSHSGRCNNLRTPEEGASNSAQRRILPSLYQDGISSPRTRSVQGSPLPSARLISQRLHQEVNVEEQYSLMLMQWGQFLDHDMVMVPTAQPGCARCQEGQARPTSCFPIPVPAEDDFYVGAGAPTCLPFTRSLAGQQELGPRQQLNVVTAYIDGSMLYGSEDSRNQRLRDGRLLRSIRVAQSELLPLQTDIEDCRAASGHCFLAGDERANEQPGLTALHTLMLRQHNYIAGQLGNINPHWAEDQVYQETRRVVIAIIQHITYNEFLPRVLGPQISRRFSLELEEVGYYDQYSSTCSAGIFNEFSAAAFRFGHSMIQPVLHLRTEREMMARTGGRNISLRKHFHNPDFILANQHAVEDIIRSGLRRVEAEIIIKYFLFSRGLVLMPMGGVDSKFSREVTNHLFEERRKKFSGLDLVAINIQRGRDHGLPGYNNYREVCGLSRLEAFNTSDSTLTRTSLQQMAAIYRHPDDVDLFTGLMSEETLEGALVGPTLGCLLALQFKNLRQCDRFWYETADSELRYFSVLL